MCRPSSLRLSLPLPIIPVLAVLALASPARAQSSFDQAAAYDAYGTAVAVGDFDQNGFDDLAVGIPGEDHSDAYSAGAVRVYYGAGAGFATGGEAYFAEGVNGFPSTPLSSEALGSALAVGDFNADGVDDLAIGAPGERVGLDYGAGAVFVLFGLRGSGLVATFSQVVHQDTAGVQGSAEPYDNFGSTLAVADFDRDNADDLAIGVPYEKIGSSKYQAGAVNVLFGSAGLGLSGTDDQIWYQDLGSVTGSSASYDRYGLAVAAGDFDRDGWPDLAIGIPGKEIANPVPGWEDAANAGSVHVLYGWPFVGPSAARQAVLLPASTATQDFVFTEGSGFGTALTSGDFDSDGVDDLAIGSPRESTNLVGVTLPDAGVVHVLFGEIGNGLRDDGHPRYHQDTPGIGGVAEPYDAFGATLATGTFDFTGQDALVIGVPGENIGSLTSAGAVHVLYASPSGPRASGSQLFYQNVPGVEGTSGAYDAFGRALAAGDVDGDGVGDLVIGVPGETVSTYARAAAVGVLRGTAENGITTAGDRLVHELVWTWTIEW